MGNTKEIRVLLVDDHPIVRAGINNLLRKDKLIKIVGEAENGVDALRYANELFPDVMLLDIEMPLLDGREVARQLNSKGFSGEILVLSAHSDESIIQEMYSYGISGYLLKDEVGEVIIDAIHGVVRGEKGWMSRCVASKIASRLQDDQKSKSILTVREKEVLKGIVDGQSNQEIAYSLQISEKTIEKHTNMIYKKLGVVSRVEAAVLAVREGWVQ